MPRRQPDYEPEAKLYFYTSGMLAAPLHPTEGKTAGILPSLTRETRFFSKGRRAHIKAAAWNYLVHPNLEEGETSFED